ncbi:MAG: signal recognition particle subunit [Candidatus Methanomethylophilaceae archaeon]|nr:signal recognition particle subunit [Candidatus Methanomethylophilaceae archaeon]MDI3542268.1 signal recognition particle subunit [Candidatus Methanomethylophilaceae archaeon]
MVLEELGKSLRKALGRITDASSVDEDLIKEVSKDLQRALLQADVNVQLVLSITKRVEERALQERPPPGMSVKEHVIKTIYEELVAVLDKGEPLPMRSQRIMLVGLYGQGKTTTAGKLAWQFSKKGFKVGLIAADVHRPAAYEQLLQLGEKVGVDVYGEPGKKDAPGIVERGLHKFKDKNVIIIDTSGRHALEEDLIQELKDVAAVAKPDEKLLVLDSQVGQQAGVQAAAFHDAVGVTGVVLTKMDGTAKGGGALSAVAQTRARIVYIGVGEQIRDLEPFNANRFISRLLGMGDLQALMDLAKESVTDVDVEETSRNIMSGRFTLKDMYNQMEAVNKMGPLKKIMSMIPGFGNVEEKMDLENSQKRLRKYKVIMDSMTEEEMEDPRIIKASRVKRIAIGAGVSSSDVRELIKQYNQSKKMMKELMGNRKMRKQLMKQMQSGDMGL